MLFPVISLVKKFDENVTKKWEELFSPDKLLTPIQAHEIVFFNFLENMPIFFLFSVEHEQNARKEVLIELMFHVFIYGIGSIYTCSSVIRVC